VVTTIVFAQTTKKGAELADIGRMHKKISRNLAA
jgi:hypothetical protein